MPGDRRHRVGGRDTPSLGGQDTPCLGPGQDTVSPGPGAVPTAGALSAQPRLHTGVPHQPALPRAAHPALPRLSLPGPQSIYCSTFSRKPRRFEARRRGGAECPPWRRGPSHLGTVHCHRRSPTGSAGLCPLGSEGRDAGWQPGPAVANGTSPGTAGPFGVSALPRPPASHGPASGTAHAARLGLHPRRAAQTPPRHRIPVFPRGAPGAKPPWLMQGDSKARVPRAPGSGAGR